ncbi:ubiquitin-like isoform X2 [Miscanthus floridulus]|uniref:ubiquitin-like isoform X2 n=1 Tax=Miscanthus floridulus TaxID=154761 RepID=UPI00345A482E
MTIMVRTLRGDRVALDVDGTATMAQLKAMVMAREGVTVGAQRLFFAGDGLPVVAHYGVRQGSVVFLSLQLRADDDASQRTRMRWRTRGEARTSVASRRSEPAVAW